MASGSLKAASSAGLPIACTQAEQRGRCGAQRGVGVDGVKEAGKLQGLGCAGVIEHGPPASVGAGCARGLIGAST